MLPPLIDYARLYQELFSGVANYQQLGNKLIQLAEQAHSFRQFDKVRKYGEILSDLPLKNYQAVGLYFQAVATNNRGYGDQEKAKKLFEIAADIAPQKYRAKAILSMAAVSSHMADYESQLRFLLESARESCDISTKVRAHLGIAVYKSKEGFHGQSLKDLENLYAVARLAQPVIFFDYLNSLAVELGEAGRKQEARSICKVTLASPFAFAYPEWQETAQDLKEADRSFAVIDLAPCISPNVLPMPVVERDERRQTGYNRPARVLNLQQWKEKMGKEPGGNGQDKKSLQDMNEKDIFLRAMELFSDTKIPRNKRRRMLEAVEVIASESNETQQE